MDAGEAVQVYVKVERPGTPNPQLKAFKKLFLKKGELKTITMHLPIEAFSLYDEDGRQMVYKTDYTIYVGDSQPDSRSIALTGKKPAALKLTAHTEIELTI
jgi:beta-glucosidase